jgi:hypothetical protein
MFALSRQASYRLPFAIDRLIDMIHPKLLRLTSLAASPLPSLAGTLLTLLPSHSTQHVNSSALMAAMLVLNISTTQLSHTNLVIADRTGNVLPSKEQALTAKVCQRPRVYLRLCGEFVVAQRASDEIARLEEELR